MLFRVVMLFLLASNAWSASVSICVDMAHPPIDGFEYIDTNFISNIDRKQNIKTEGCFEETIKIWEAENLDLVVLNKEDEHVAIRKLAVEEDGYPSMELSKELYPDHGFEIDKVYVADTIYMTDLDSGDLYFWSGVSEVWKNLNLVSGFPSSSLKRYFTASTSLYFSIESGPEEGLWKVNGEVFNRVSDVPIDFGPVHPTPFGLAQIQLNGSGYEINWLENSKESKLIDLQASPIFFQALNNTFGSLMVYYSDSEFKLYWDDLDDRNDSYIDAPENWLRFKGCFPSRLESVCVFEMLGGSLNIYRMGRGELLLDAVLTHSELLVENSFIRQVNVIGDSRYINISQGDSFFLYEVNSTGINKIAGSESDSYIYFSLDPSVFYWISGSTKRIKLGSDTLYRPLFIEPEPEPEPEPEVSIEPVNDERSNNDSEEKEEVPFAEMSSSLNLYLLMLSLFILFPARLRK